MKKNQATQNNTELIAILKQRFEKNMHRHKNLDWQDVQTALASNPKALISLQAMEETGGEPDVVDLKTNGIIFIDCAAESPIGRRSFCYDKEVLDSRKENKPADNVLDVAKRMGIELLDENQYKILQKFGKFDTKTSSWLKTPDSIRKLGGAIFADYRYGQVFVYHNGASSYYAARGFRGLLKI